MNANWRRVCLDLTSESLFRHGEVLPDADARPPVEWHVAPRLGRPAIPPVGAEDGGVGELLRDRWIQVGSPLHGHGAVDDDIVLEHRDIRLSGPTRQSGIL